MLSSARLETEIATLTTTDNALIEKSKQAEEAKHERRLKLTKEESRRVALEMEVNNLRTECDSLRAETKTRI